MFHMCGHTWTLLNDLASLSFAYAAPAYYIYTYIYTYIRGGFMYSRLITKPQLIVEAGSTRLHFAPET